MKLLGGIEMRDFDDFTEKIIQISFSFLDLFLVVFIHIVFLGNGRYETARPSFTKSLPHCMKFIESSLYTDFSLGIIPFYNIYSMFFQTTSFDLVPYDFELHITLLWFLYFHRYICIFPNFFMLHNILLYIQSIL